MYCRRIALAAVVNLFANTKRVTVPARKTEAIARSKFSFRSTFLIHKRMTSEAIALLTPAIVNGLRSTSFIKTPLVLQRVAVSRRKREAFFLFRRTTSWEIVKLYGEERRYNLSKRNQKTKIGGGKQLGKRILIVDDSKFWRLVLADIVKEICGECEIFLASNGNEGIQMALKHRPDYVLTDYNMPDLTGLYLSVTLRELECFKNTGIAIFTASSDVVNEFWAERSGADRFISKMLEKEKMREEIKEFLSLERVTEKMETIHVSNVFQIVENRLKKEILEKEILSFLRYARDEMYVVLLLEDLFKKFAEFKGFRVLLLSPTEGRIYSLGEPVNKERLKGKLLSSLEKPTSPSSWSFQGSFLEEDRSPKDGFVHVVKESMELGCILFEEPFSEFILKNVVSIAQESLVTLFRNLNDFRDYIVASETDSLTGLYNKKAIMEILDRRLKVGENTAVAMIDIDDFKRINDTFGHTKGDVVLRNISTILKECVTNGRVGRYGGEEFMIVFENGKNVIETMDSIMEKVRGHRWEEVLGRPGARVTVSGGVAFSRKGISTIELVELADKKLYEAKKAGKDRYFVFES